MAGTDTETEYVFPPTLELIACPFAAYERLRNEQPVYRAPGGEFIVSRYEDLAEIYRQDDLFVSRDRIGHPIRNFIELPEPEHMERRLLLFRSMSPSRLRKYEPIARAFAHELTDGFIDRGEIDFIHEFAYPFSTFVVSGILGLSREDYERLRRWGLADEGSAGAFIGEERRRGSIDRWSELYAYTRERPEERATSPRDDLLSELMQARVEKKGELDPDVMMVDVGAIIAAAMHTTANLIADALKVLIDHPEVMEHVRADHSLIPAMIVETLRLESPVQWNPRIVARDTGIAGVEIPAGSKVILLIGSANRDPTIFEHPEEFDPRRANVTRHLGLGNGSHFCLGAPLARLEAKIAFEELFSRIDNIQLDVQGYVQGSHIEFRGPEKMPITLDPLP